MAYSYKQRPINHLLPKNKLGLPKTVSQVCNLGNLGDRLLVYKTRNNLHGIYHPKPRHS
jgi:hypothetical protein